MTSASTPRYVEGRDSGHPLLRRYATPVLARRGAARHVPPLLWPSAQYGKYRAIAVVLHCWGKFQMPEQTPSHSEKKTRAGTRDGVALVDRVRAPPHPAACWYRTGFVVPLISP